jgi:hypothetical protein
MACHWESKPELLFGHCLLPVAIAVNPKRIISIWSGFNCGEASNIATPEWLTVAKEAAIRRASTNRPPMLSHYQLLYELALSMGIRYSNTTSLLHDPHLFL